MSDLAKSSAADPFPPYLIIGSGMAAFDDVEDLARWIHAQRHGRGLQVLDHQLKWQNPQGDRATVTVQILDKQKHVDAAFLLSTAGEDAAAFMGVLEETRPRMARAVA